MLLSNSALLTSYSFSSSISLVSYSFRLFVYASISASNLCCFSSKSSRILSKCASLLPTCQYKTNRRTLYSPISTFHPCFSEVDSSIFDLGLNHCCNYGFSQNKKKNNIMSVLILMERAVSYGSTLFANLYII